MDPVVPLLPVLVVPPLLVEVALVELEVPDEPELDDAVADDDAVPLVAVELLALEPPLEELAVVEAALEAALAAVRGQRVESKSLGTQTPVWQASPPTTQLESSWQAWHDAWAADPPQPLVPKAESARSRAANFNPDDECLMADDCT